ncbi:MAG: hypothetical protein WCR04_09240, partial [Fibrobacteraceae bacterium]
IILIDSECLRRAGGLFQSMLDDFFVCHAYRFSSAMTAIFHGLFFIHSDYALAKQLIDQR